MRSLLCVSFLIFSQLQITEVSAFENLDFEQAMPVITGDFSEDCCTQSLEDLVPHWSATQFRIIDGEKVSAPDATIGAYYNTAHLGGVPGIVALFDTHTGLYNSPISGEFSVALDTRAFSSAELFQTVLVPSGSKSIRFSGALHTSGLYDDSFPLSFILRAPADQIEVSLGGTQLEVVELTDEGGFATYGANIPPALAGTEAELRFEVPTSYLLLLDDIRFSPVAVPEPSTIASFAIALSACFGVRRSRE